MALKVIEQIFLRDPFNNMIELHQLGTCRCITKTRPAVAVRTMR